MKVEVNEDRKGGTPMAARAMKRVNDLKSAVARATPMIKGEDKGAFGSRIKDKLTRALRKMHRMEFRHLHGTSKYKPHQGAQECARRVKQGINDTRYIHGAQYPGGILRWKSQERL